MPPLAVQDCAPGALQVRVRVCPVNRLPLWSNVSVMGRTPAPSITTFPVFAASSTDCSVADCVPVVSAVEFQMAEKRGVLRGNSRSGRSCDRIGRTNTGGILAVYGRAEIGAADKLDLSDRDSPPPDAPAPMFPVWLTTTPEVRGVADLQSRTGNRLQECLPIQPTYCLSYPRA